MQLLHVGFSNFIVSDRIVSLTTPNSAPIRRAVQTAKDNSKLIDLTNGRKSKAVIFMENGSIILSALNTDTLSMRINEGKEGEEKE